MAKLNGVALVIEILHGTGTPVYKQIANQTTVKLGITFDEIDVTDKTSGDFGDFISGLGKGDCPFEGFYNDAPDTNMLSFEDLLLLAGPNKSVSVRLRLEQGVSDKGITFPAIISSLDLDAGVNAGMKVTGTFKLKAKPVIATITA
jgi:hypothetical protein